MKFIVISFNVQHSHCLGIYLVQLVLAIKWKGLQSFYLILDTLLPDGEKIRQFLPLYY